MVVPTDGISITPDIEVTLLFCILTICVAYRKLCVLHFKKTSAGLQLNIVKQKHEMRIV